VLVDVDLEVCGDSGVLVVCQLLCAVLQNFRACPTAILFWVGSGASQNSFET
jgi:hypothetical protein